ncbi:hypothetical protein RIF29_40129 [Crotalaria pallida]|uniref:Uncharacterized protein n=1 Tax=Crotalaria pallida TaxID=3830 RepID=A0AAN9E805_CROPI
MEALYRPAMKVASFFFNYNTDLHRPAMEAASVMHTIHPPPSNSNNHQIQISQHLIQAPNHYFTQDTIGSIATLPITHKKSDDDDKQKIVHLSRSNNALELLIIASRQLPL